jgi:hypothetical protein
MNEIVNQTNNLRDSVRIFQKTLELDSGYAFVLAEKPEFIRISGLKLYPKIWFSDNFLCGGDCKTPSAIKRFGFVIIALHKEAMRYYVVFQCDTCRNIQLSYSDEVDVYMKTDRVEPNGSP